MGQGGGVARAGATHPLLKDDRVVARERSLLPPPLSTRTPPAVRSGEDGARAVRAGGARRGLARVENAE